MLLNNGLGVIPTMILAFSMGELADVDVKVWFMSSTTVLLLLSGIIGTGLCYFALAVQKEIDATSFMVLQNTVRMAVVVVGIIVFADPLGWPWQVMGLAVSFSGAIWYGKAQNDAKKELEQ